MIQLKNHGIDGKLWEWIDSWLTRRKQRVVLNGVKSDWENVLSGVPQGSVLGPLLFLVFVNIIEEGLHNRVLKFADDVKLIGVSMKDTYIQSIQDDLDKLVKWSNDWQMAFNYEKCKVMHIGRINDNFNYHMEGHPLDKIYEEKDLGVIVTNDLKSERQCEAASKKAFKMLGIINRKV